MSKTQWMIITWQNDYGRLLEIYYGTEEDAKERARNYINRHAPLGIVELITPTQNVRSVHQPTCEKSPGDTPQ